MNITSLNFAPRAQGYLLDTRPESFGEVLSSSHLVGDSKALNDRLEADGYLFLPGLLDREAVLEARRYTVELLASEGRLEPGTDPMLAIAREGLTMGGRHDLPLRNVALQKCLYSGRIMEFYRELFGEEVLHFTYTWYRAVAPGKGTNPHCDMVFMGRGERDKLLTAWVPTGDVPIESGGLMLLEGSHLQRERLHDYLTRDVDSYCTNGAQAADIEAGRKLWEWDGVLSSNPVALREALGGRWLTTNFHAGDVLTFKMQLVHASLDNLSRSIRLSSDSRYQPASLPADERWVGENPVGHSVAGKRGRIC